MVGYMCGQLHVWLATCVVGNMCGRLHVWSDTCMVGYMCGQLHVWLTTCQMFNGHTYPLCIPTNWDGLFSG